MTPRTRTAHRPKFKVGQVVVVVDHVPYGAGCIFKIGMVQRISSAAFWYSPQKKAKDNFYTEDILRPLTKRERGA